MGSFFKILLFECFFFCTCVVQVFAYTPVKYSSDTTYTGNINNRSISQLNKKYAQLNQQLTKRTQHYLQKAQRSEKKICLKLLSKNSVIAQQLLHTSADVYQKALQKSKNPLQKIRRITAYIPGLDSIHTATGYLLQNGTMGNASSLLNLNHTTNSLQNNLEAATITSQALSQRMQLLNRLLTQAGMLKYLKNFQQQAFYYQQQVAGYKEMLHDEKQLEQKMLAIVRNLPAFQDFWQRNSLLAQLFPVTANVGTTQALAGLQSRNQVQQILTQQLGGAGTGTGSNPQQFIQQQMQAAQNQLNTLKNKINQLSGGNSELIMPDFTPNQQKTKTIWQRLEYGMNIQSQKTNYYLPVTSDIAGTIGYKLNDKSTVGVGVAYKMGWGNGINDVKISNEGIGLRSFLDIKIKGSIWVTGGYEQNYQTAFNRIPQLRDYSAWQTSGLIGVTKKMKVGKKASNIQLLWDFLSYRAIPATQPLKFRIGYNF